MKLPLIAAIITVLCAHVPARADYVITSGDQVRLTFLGVPGGDAQSVVDTDGMARFPLIGAVRAGGLTLEEFQEEVRLVSEGRSYPYRNERGELITIDLDGFDIFVEISEYRPVMVVGYVAAPGVVAYQPGLTVQAAIARAGGVTVLPGMPDPAVRGALSDLAEQQALAYQIASLRARLWRYEALLARDPSTPLPSLSDLPVDVEVVVPVLETEQAALTSALSLEVQRRETLASERDGTNTALQLVRRQLDITQSIVEGAEEALARLEGLAERGLTQVSNVEVSRRALAQSNSQLMELLRLERDFEARVEAVKAELVSFDDRQRFEVLGAISDLQGEINEATARLAGLRLTSPIAGGAGLGADVFSDAASMISIVRGGETIAAANLSAATMPGDVITVHQAVGD